MAELEGFRGVIRDRSPKTCQTELRKTGEARPNYSGGNKHSFKVLFPKPRNPPKALRQKIRLLLFFYTVVFI